MDEHLYPFSWQSSSRKKTHWWLIKIFCTLYFFVLRIQLLLCFSYTRTYNHCHWLFIIYLLTSTPKSIFISLLTLTSYIHGRIYGPIRTVMSIYSLKNKFRKRAHDWKSYALYKMNNENGKKLKGKVKLFSYSGG